MQLHKNREICRNVENIVMPVKHQVSFFTLLIEVYFRTSKNLKVSTNLRGFCFFTVNNLIMLTLTSISTHVLVVTLPRDDREILKVKVAIS